MKHIFLASVLVILGFIVTSCKDDDNKLSPQILKGTEWKTIGIVDVKTDSLVELGYNCERCYMLSFDIGDNPLHSIIDGDELFYTAFTSANTLHGTYDVNYLTYSISFTTYWQTIVAEHGDGELWKSILLAVEKFSLQEDELRLYYNGNKNYLHFKSQ
jgi:hypothetical protein